MTTIIRTLLNWYVYIASYLCPQYLSGFKQKTSESPISSCEEIELLATEYSDDDDIAIYNRNYRQFMDCNDYTTADPIKKSSSTTLPLHYCGWCGLYVDRPTHAYMDKIYCNISCRNYQIMKDNPQPSQEQKRKMTVSFSL